VWLLCLVDNFPFSALDKEVWVDLHLTLLICVGFNCSLHVVVTGFFWSLFYEPYVHTQPSLWSMESCLFNDCVVEKRDTIMPCIVLFLRTLLNLLIRFQLSLLILRFQLNLLILRFQLNLLMLYSHQHFAQSGTCLLVTLFVNLTSFF
jgi:hypothetical protein